MTVIQDLRSQTPKRSTTRALSSIKRIARHHSATTSGDFWSFWNNRWKGLGWVTGGYHEIILRDGTVQLCYDPNMVTNGVGNHNSDTYHICVVGNGSFTEAQEKAFEERCRLAMKRFNIPVERVLGHKEFRGATTACPGISMDTVRYRLKQPIVVINKKEDEEMQKQIEALESRIRDLEKQVKQQQSEALSSYAEEPRKWAMKEGISDGTRPKMPVTREQAWTMLHRAFVR